MLDWVPLGRTWWIALPIRRPRVHDGLPFEVRLEIDLGSRKRFQDELADLRCREAEARDVICELREGLRGRRRELHERIRRVRHRHERDAHLWSDETVIRLAFGGGVDHVGCIVTRAAARHGNGADESREANAPEVDHDRLLGRELLVVPTQIATEKLTIELVASVHGRWVVPLPFTDAAISVFGLGGREPVDRDRARKNELHRFAAPRRLLRSEMEKRERPFDVHTVRRFGRELGFCRQKRRQMKNRLDLVLGYEA